MQASTLPIAGAAPRPWKQAAAWLLVLGPFFFASYGFANWVASRRADVGAVVFAWEQHIPFLAWTIVPYWSIDLLYAASLFVCADRAQLNTHARRLLGAQLFAVACFVAFPLRFTFPRPDADGISGWMFDALTAFDKPFNQAPSLHIALLAILWVLYAKHINGPWRWLMHAWFALIGVSVLTTYQHHFIDLPTGWWLGWLCIWLWPEHERSPLAMLALTADPTRRRLGTRYALAGVALAGLSLWLGGWALWLAWPAASLMLVAAAYGFVGSGAFQKCADGRLSAAAYWLLGPYLLGAWLNSRCWTRSVPPAVEVVPGVYLGRVPSARDLHRLGMGRVVDLAAELPCRSEQVHYLNIPVLDLVAPTSDELARAVRGIESGRKSGTVLVCCALGFSRSALAVVAWLVWSGRMANVDDAVAAVRRVRPQLVLQARHYEVLRG